MTRPFKLLKSESIQDLDCENEKNLPENSLRYKIYKLVNAEPITLNEIRIAINSGGTRRYYEKTLTEMTNDGHINRKRCRCGQGYLYFKK